MTVVHEPFFPPPGGLRLPPSLSPLALATQVTKAIQCQDLRMRGGGSPEVAALRSALDGLQDVMARVLMRAPAMMSRLDYERMAIDLRAMLQATMQEPLDPAELPDLHRWVTTATIKLAVMVAVTD
ncbi:MAG TPA: hypothetical protein VGD77_15165 [Gemmatimonadaceae bacterium]